MKPTDKVVNKSKGTSTDYMCSYLQIKKENDGSCPIVATLNFNREKLKDSPH